MIKIKNLSKSYSDIKAISNISLTVNEGELFGLIGPDGAGKTSLFRILTGLLLPDKGMAEVMGFDVIHNYKDVRNNVGYMPSKFSLYQDLTIKENIDFFAKLFKTSFDENRSMINDIYIQIEPFKNRRAGKLSGGMKQKLALCCALIHKPNVLLLDEPTTGVDPVSRKEFWDMLHKIKKMGVTILVSTPYMDEALLCDRVALMQEGLILNVNTPKKIISDYPKQLYAVKTEKNFILLSFLRIHTQVDLCYLYGEYLHFTLNDTANNQDSLNTILLESKCNIMELKVIEANIEDCFISLIILNKSQRNTTV